MSENYPWYTLVTGPGLLQGDILYKCPVIIPSGEIPEGDPGDEYVLETGISIYDVIVMSQSCDLEQENLDLVLVCPHSTLTQFVENQENGFFKSKKFKDALKQGNVHGYHLLNKCDLDGWATEPRIVDFRNVYSLPLPFIKRLANKRGERLRLLPPYREHLSQAFARYFMRVGLPLQIEFS
jgi:hypothetical protein